MDLTFSEDCCAVQTTKELMGTQAYGKSDRANGTSDSPDGIVLPIQEAMSEQALHVSELRYRRLFEAARDGILILESDTGRVPNTEGEAGPCAHSTHAVFGSGDKGRSYAGAGRVATRPKEEALQDHDKSPENRHTRFGTDPAGGCRGTTYRYGTQ